MTKEKAIKMITELEATAASNLQIAANLRKDYGMEGRGWEDAARMKVWPIAVEKFKRIYPFIAPVERRYIPDVFLQELEPA